MNRKNVLFIAPSVYGYEFDIINSMKENSFNVTYFNERVSDSSIVKILLRLRLKWLTGYFVNRYYKKILKDVSNIELAYLFILIPESIPIWFIEEIKKKYNDLKVIVYTWDSIKNRKITDDMFNIADSVWSFDRIDCQEDSRLKFLPLFYTNDFRTELVEKKYKFCFFGTLHTDRYKLVKDITSDNDNNFIYWYCPSKLLYFLKIIFTDEYKGISLSEINFSPISRESINKAVRSSSCVIDIHHHNQNGLTMRTVEAMSANAKMLTTNYDVINYDFYHENNIQVFNREQARVDSEFLNLPPKKLDKHLINKYSLNNWIVAVFDIEK